MLTCLQVLSCSGYRYLWDVDSSNLSHIQHTQKPLIEMIGVPANTSGFNRGFAGVSNATPVHTVASITGFAIGKFELRYAEWQSVVTWAVLNGYVFANTGTMGSGAGTEQHPVATINWRDAVIWCNAASEKDGFTPVYYTDPGFSILQKIATNAASFDATPGSEDAPFVLWSANGYRLPTEAEWEYAGRYIDGIVYTPGDAPSGWQDNNPANSLIDAAEIDAVAWTSSNSGISTHPVGALAANALGIHDMTGNVFEMTYDLFGIYTTSSPYTDADSTGPTSGASRSPRGMAAYLSPQSSAKVSQRNLNNPWFAGPAIGFRVVRRP